MQRQSLSSPNSKLCVNGEERIEEREDELLARDEEEDKLEKQTTMNSRSAEKSIHLIPILTIACILVLYLCSHVPSQKELAQLNGSKATSIKLDSVNSELKRLTEIDRSDVFAIRGHRSLQEIDNKAKDSRLHRKFGYPH
ncbi:hypothetical protein Syun_018134 [Stephania yunnanensis]|uniref:Uncharacterized protein n=1 Tax=Stephania yunnanensis TaxID=152371 RepID=A0AAP0NUQ7_9MAGN